MFCPPADEESQIVQTVLPPKIFRKIKKSNRKTLQRKVKKKYSKFASTMSAWAENFAVAATWQLKHQVAYWKAKASALEYENNVLHDVIRRNHLKYHSFQETENKTETELEQESGTDNDVDEEVEDDNDFEVSEEYIQFLTDNIKIKEEAKRERAILKAKTEAEYEESLKQERRETEEESKERMKHLYGDKWQRISALEMSMLSNFIHESDKMNPPYWPNIPFNFNSS